MSAYFITAIGTEVGKTHITCALYDQLSKTGKTVRAIKPIISGYTAEEETDTSILANLQHLDVADVSPWRFEAGLSPHLAAAAENAEISSQAVVEFCQKTIAQHPTTLIEGVGGLMVPLHGEFTVLDWVAALDIPVILVAATYLGAINHSLLSYDALRARNIEIAGIIINESANDSIGIEDTLSSIQPFVGQTRILTVPRDQDSAWKNAPNLLSLLS